MIYWILKYLVRIAIKIYFKDIYIYGIERLPRDKPLVIASNHPSAFIEPCLYGSLFPIEIHFMTRGDLFIKQFKWFFKGTNQIPIYRRRDGMNALRKNEHSFAEAVKVLKNNGRVTIFPESTTVEVKRIRPLKHGASRLIMRAFKNEKIVPLISSIVCNYTDLHRWRSYVFIHISELYDPTEIIRDVEKPLQEMTRETYEKLKKGAIHIPKSTDEEWVNVLLQVVTEEYRGGALKMDDKQLFKSLQEVATAGDSRPGERERLIKVATDIRQANEETSTTLGAPIRKFSGLDYLKLGFYTILSLPAFLFLGIPILIARYVSRNSGFNREFKMPVFLGITMILDVLIVFVLLIILLLSLQNWIIWAYLLILPLSIYLFTKWGDKFQDFQNASRFSRLSSLKKKQYADLRQIILNHFSL